MRIHLSVLLFVASSLSAPFGDVVRAQTGATKKDITQTRAEELFAHRVLPVFKAKCFACHGEDPKEIRGELNMMSREGLLKGGESEEPALAPGKPTQSPLLQAVRWDGLEMPPKENDRLTAEQIAHIREWIQAGAPWPDADRLKEIVRTTAGKWNAPGGVAVATSGGLSDDWTNRKYKPENLWAYQPLWIDTQGLLANVSRNPVDVLIDARAQEMGVASAPPADRRTLIRRATFDLIGLPPTQADVDAFVNDEASDAEAFAKVVDRLLASPHYGEQWGRHWLDVVRYADSSGYANDYERGNSWRYRDYVVRAFNADKPYDQFIREQIAGDELADTSTEGQRKAGSRSELLIAAGFLRMGPWELTGMEVAQIARQRFLDDVTDAVGQVFLAHMLQCAKCHDHKFDPIPTRDYYSMQATFATTQFAERHADFLPQENTSGFDERQYLLLRQKFYQKTLRELENKRTIEAARAWYAEKQIDPSMFEQVVAEIRKKHPKRKINVNQVRTQLAERKADPATIPPRHVGFEPRDFGIERISRKGIERLKWRLERYETYAFSVYSGRTPSISRVTSPLRLPADPLKGGVLEQTAILVGGDPFSPQAPVSPGVLSVVEGIHGECGDPKTTAAPISGRRTALANWIASPDNPLTARVMMNRVWQWHFGRAIAGNANNFGATGKKPSHPKLLDYLAGRFVREGWSVKSMHRLMMNSETYRRGSEHPHPELTAQKDPLSISYAVFMPRRLEAEELRDSMLQASGELNRDVGGIPIRPEMNLEAALQPRQVMGTFAEAWQPSPLPKQRHRRSLYALRIRGQRDPFLEVFNAPAPDLSCEARDTSTVTPQVFAMFNSEITFDRALALAKKVTNGRRENNRFQPDVIQKVFQRVYGRAPSAGEVDACLEHWKNMTARHEKLTFERPQYPREVVREAVEENTGEKFTFVEPLENYKDFVPDLKPYEASAELRGLAEVCLVLLNSNEFAYVY